MDAFLRFLNMMTGGKYGFIIELFVCETMFLFNSKCRKIPKIPYPIFYVAVYAVYFTVGYFMPLLPVPSLTSLLIFAASVFAAWAVFDVSINRILFNCVAGYAVQNLAINVCNCIFEWVSLWGWARFFIRLIIKAAIYAACYFAFAKKSQKAELNIRSIRLYVTSLLTVIVTSVLFSIVLKNGSFGIEVNLSMTISCLLALMLQFSEFKSGNLYKEKALIEQFLYHEQKQHSMTQETIDLINIKYHDLKKQVAALKEMLGERADVLLGDTEKTLSVYDDLIKTGNKNLDLIVSEEKAHGRKYGISIDVMADGCLLDFMAPADIYSLFGNALNNAVECAMNESESDRNIGLKIHMSGDYVCIAVTNVCTRPVKIVNGLPVTSKNDTKFHGYGMRSMEYIVKKYGGNMVVDLTDNTFLVKIIIKKPSPQTSEQ